MGATRDILGDVYGKGGIRKYVVSSALNKLMTVCRVRTEGELSQ